jgi:FkbH-like protein
MKLVEALELIKRPIAGEASPYSVALACGCEPLHLQTFVTAELRERLPAARLEVSAGVFDDLLGNIRRAGRSAVDGVAVVIEWSDIDARLGIRRLGGWRVSDLADIVAQAQTSLHHLERELLGAATSTRVVCCPPTLPLPPLFPERPDESGAQELALRDAVAGFLARLGRHPGLSICSLQLVDELSPPAARRDVQAELNAGFPYSLAHASVLAQLLATALASPTPKKGLITDLDETLWAGVLGESGVSNLSWDLDSRSQAHALYQQLLASLASAGVLIGVASRNDPRAVAEAFERPDLLIPKASVFPLEAQWDAKSKSIERILEVWNISPAAVVFVDDDPLALDEARDAFPDLETIRFPHRDDAGVWVFLARLRTLFGKSAVTAEDDLRLGSSRAAGAYREAAAVSQHSSDDFLARANATLEFSCDGAHRSRALDLINKTNQFNLNGRRLTDAALGRALGDGATRLVTASYEDRYGPLGTVAALLVRPDPTGLAIDSWVMSCRAFSRRVEHHCLHYLFEKFAVDIITAAYRFTNRNAPLREFLGSLLGESPEDPVRLTLDAFCARTPALVHRVLESGS